jgi:hypothetical protein
VRHNPLLMTVMGNPCHSGREYQANPFVLIDSQTNKIIRTWRGSMMDRKPWHWAQDAARRLGRPVFIVAHPYVPKTFRAGVEVSPMFYYGGPYQEVHPDGSTSRGPAGGYKRNPSFMASMAGGLTGGLVANALSNPPRTRKGAENAIDKAIGIAWSRLMSGVQVPIMDITRIFRDIKLEMAAGVDLESAVRSVGTQYRVNKNPRRHRAKKVQSNPVGRRRKVTMSLQKFAEYIKKKGDPKLWNDFVRKVKGYQKWTHGSLPKNVTIEVIDKPGMSGLWMTYDAGKVPESAYVMPAGSKRKGAWKHPWDTMPKIKHDAEAGIIMHKLSGKSKVTDFYHR